MGNELIKIAEGFSMVAEAIQELAKNNKNSKSEKNPEKQTEQTKAKITENSEKKPASPKGNSEKISIENIRAVLAEKSQDGKSKEVRALLNQYGVAKLSAVAEKDYPVLLQKARVL